MRNATRAGVVALFLSGALLVAPARGKDLLVLEIANPQGLRFDRYRSKQGLSSRQIAAKLGVPRTTVRRALAG